MAGWKSSTSLYTCKRKSTRRMAKSIKGKTHLPAFPPTGCGAQDQCLCLAIMGRAKLPDPALSAALAKSNSIALAGLSPIGPAQWCQQAFFDSVIVVTDRKVLDQQLQNNIYQFEHKTGVVQRLTKTAINWQQLWDMVLTLSSLPPCKISICNRQGGKLPERKYASDHRRGPQLTGRWGQQKWKKSYPPKPLKMPLLLSRMMTICPMTTSANR